MKIYAFSLLYISESVSNSLCCVDDGQALPIMGAAELGAAKVV